MSHPGSNTNAAFDSLSWREPSRFLQPKALTVLCVLPERKAGLMCQGSLGKSGVQGCDPGCGTKYPLGLGHIIRVWIFCFLLIFHKYFAHFETH